MFPFYIIFFNTHSMSKKLPEEEKKIPACFTLSPKNLELLRKHAGLATVSRFLDHLIESTLDKKGGRKN